MARGTTEQGSKVFDVFLESTCPFSVKAFSGAPARTYYRRAKVWIDRVMGGVPDLLSLRLIFANRKRPNLERTRKEIDYAINRAVDSARGIADSKLLFDLYKAELDSARHYENMRTTMTGSLILVSLALTGVAFAKEVPVARWLVGTAMIAVGALTFLMALSITRAFVLHRWNAQHLRRALTRIPSAGPAQSLFHLTRERWRLDRPLLLRSRIWIFAVLAGCAGCPDVDWRRRVGPERHCCSR